jgi:hypothetical protein
MADVTLLFANNADTMIATKALKDAGISAKMIPKPASVSSASNLCLSVDGGIEAQVKKVLSNAGVALGGVMK